jgi:hypothetical protein
MNIKILVIIIALLASFKVQSSSLEEVINSISKYYGPKNERVNIDAEALRAIPDDEWQRIVINWFDIEGGNVAKPDHWHTDNGPITLDLFTSNAKLYQFDKAFETAVVKCNRVYEGERKRYFELLFYSNGNQWMDINQHDDNSYSLTLWDWYSTVGIESNGSQAIYHWKPIMYRWNNSIDSDLVNNILKTGKFNLYLEPNSLRIGGRIMNKEMIREYKVFPKLNLKGAVQISNLEVAQNCFDK